MNMRLFFVLLFLPCFALASVPTWKIIPSESHLTFSATQNNAPVTGEFKKFTGEIHYDPEQLAESNVDIVVDVASVSDAYNQIADTLKDKEWFNTASFPKAIFKAAQFEKTGEKTYLAKGSLTIRDKTLPCTLTFIQEEYTPNTARVKGSTTIKRTAFGVGQGEWSATDTVKDEVRIDFLINAVRDKSESTSDKKI